MSKCFFIFSRISETIFGLMFQRKLEWWHAEKKRVGWVDYALCLRDKELYVYVWEDSGHNVHNNGPVFDWEYDL